MAKKSKKRYEEEIEEEIMESEEYEDEYEDSDDYDDEYEEEYDESEEYEDEYEDEYDDSEEYDDEDDEYEEEEYDEDDRAYFRHQRRIRNQTIAIIVFIIVLGAISFGAVVGINTAIDKLGNNSQAAELQRQIQEMEQNNQEQGEEEQIVIEAPDENY